MSCHGPLAELIRQLDATPHGPSDALARLGTHTFDGICTDTRQLTSGCVFVALQGERFDGHDYVQQALAQGAIAAIVAQPVSSVDSGLQLVVDDTLVAYQAIARWWRSQFEIPVLAITGSAGKTSTKEMLAAALNCYGNVLKTEKNYNNDIGVPLTLLQLDDTYRFVVLELAMRGPGEIARLTRTALPTHGIIVNIGTAHIGRLGSKAAIARAKCELLEYLDPDRGIAILNGEDTLLLETAAKVWQGSTKKFGFSGAELTTEWQPQPPQLAWQGHLLPVPLKGRHQGLNYAAVIEAIASLDLDISVLESGIELPPEASGRNQRYRLPDGVELLDESYNAAPEAVIAALQLLCEPPASSSVNTNADHPKWAVLGPMRELGDAANELYATIGQAAALLLSQGLHICLFDPDAEMTALAHALPPDRIHHFSERDPMAEWLCSAVQQGDRILFKAARSIAIETVMHRFIQCRYPDWQLPIQN